MLDIGQLEYFLMKLSFLLIRARVVLGILCLNLTVVNLVDSSLGSRIYRRIGLSLSYKISYRWWFKVQTKVHHTMPYSFFIVTFSFYIYDLSSIHHTSVCLLIQNLYLVEHILSLTQRTYSFHWCLLWWSTDYLTIATTRPETLFGDTAIAVNPYVRWFFKEKQPFYGKIFVFQYQV